MENHMIKSIAAIEQSISQNEIVHVTGTEELDAELQAACDDSVETRREAGGPVVTEYWGTDENGGEWRVHSRGPEADDDTDACLQEEAAELARDVRRMAGDD